MREAWDGYYQYKGKEWMEAKKIEMDGAVRNNSLQQWIDTNITNHNVWYYYWIYGQVPNPQGIPIDQVFSTQDTESSFSAYAICIPIVIGGAIVAFLIIRKRMLGGKRAIQ